MTYLFSQLGWLQTLPNSWTQEEVIKRYMDKDVIREMTVRADVFAASLDRAGFSRAHRRLDIWFVKFGQDADASFGITTNLQDQGLGIGGVLNHVLDDSVTQDWWITQEEAEVNWPAGEFRQLTKVGSNAEENSQGQRASAHVKELPKRPRATPASMSRNEAESIFFRQWKTGFSTHPEIYPTRETNISNENKELILRKIERGQDPHQAFVNVLQKP
jgi:hypothetical protein